MEFETRCVHTGVYKDTDYNSCTTPLYPSSTFFWEDIETHKGYDYSRTANPTRRALEENLASLEGGIDCRATSTGMSAITAIMHLFKPGDHIISQQDIYGGTYRLFADVYAARGIRFSFVDLGDPDHLRQALTPDTKCVWIESPSNPLLRLVDLRAITEICQASDVLTVADNTFMSPYLQRPFEHGVDLVMHSTTKYLNGHSDVVGGCVVTRHAEHAEQIGYLVNALGLACSPQDAWLVLRGVKTLGPRMEAHQRGAQELAEFLDADPHVERVHYPGLPHHPDHELAKRQQSGFGGMLSFELRGGREAVKRLLSRAQLFLTAESLGGVESLISYPETMSHASMALEARRAAGITENTVRISVGIENPRDLINDLRQAFGA